MLDVPHIGPVKKDDRFGLYWSEAMPIAFLRGHKCRFALGGYVEDCRKSDFHQAINNALAIDDSVLARAQPHVLRYRREMIALQVRHGWPHTQNNDSTDVWNQVHFGSEIYVSRRARGDDEDGIYLSLECNCDWEVEHGLQIVLRDGLEITKIGPFDGHLTNSDAFDDRALKGVVYRGSDPSSRL
jgi:hypothetical protein